jgi:hypothetical protein
LSAGQGIAIARLGADLYRRVDARQAVRRIAENSFRYFEGRRPPAGDAFWKAIKRDVPLVDPWGRPYAVEHREDGGFLCRSAGQDRVFDTDDDLVFEVPYGFTLDMLQPEKTSLETPPEQRVRDAK